MSIIGTNTPTGILQNVYNKVVHEVIDREAGPFFNWLNKAEDLYGATWTEGLIYGPGSPGSTNFGVSQAVSGPSSFAPFSSTRTEWYSSLQLLWRAIKETGADEGAFYNLMTKEVRNKVGEFARNIGRFLPGAGSGQMSTISSTTDLGTASLILANPSDIHKFEIGQSLVFALNDTSALRASTALTVLKVNVDTFTLTMSGLLNTVAGITVGDAVFLEGTYTAASDRLLWNGLSSWIPDATPSGVFLGVDRTLFPTRLGGHRLNGATYSCSDALLSLATKMSQAHVPAGPRYAVFCNPANKQRIIEERDSKIRYTNMTTKASISFEGAVLHSALGDLEVYADPNFDTSHAYLCQEGAFTWRTLGQFPETITMDNLTWSPLPQNAGFEIRFGGLANLTCSAPGYCGVVYNFGVNG